MTFTKLMTSAAVVALLSGPALAQDAVTDPATDPGAGTTYADPVTPAPLFTSIDEMTVGDVLGMIVYGPDGDRIGEIDYVVPHGDGYAGVIGIGGFLGLGEYTVAIPLEEFQLAPEGASFTLDTDKETLEQTPEFDESGAESLPDETLVADLIDRDASDSAPEADSDTMNDDMGTDGAAMDDTATGGAEVDAEMDAEADAEMDAEGADVEAGAEVESGAEVETEAEGAETDGSTDMAPEGDAETAGETEAEDCPPGVIDAECAAEDPASEGEEAATENN